jgi:hypothetical protein
MNPIGDVTIATRTTANPGAVVRGFVLLPAANADADPKRQRGVNSIPLERFGLVWNVALPRVGAMHLSPQGGRQYRQNP